jgi:hypothetical protein
LRRARSLSSLVDAKGGRRLGGSKWEMVLGSTLEESGSGGYVRAAESIWAAAIAGLRPGGGGAVRTGDGAPTCENLGGGGGTLSGVATFGLVGDVTGFRMGTATIERDKGEAGLTGDCVRGRGGAAGGLSLRITGGARRGGRGAELLISFFREGTGRAGTGVGTLRPGGVGAREPSDFGMDGGFPSR